MSSVARIVQCDTKRIPLVCRKRSPCPSPKVANIPSPPCCHLSVAHGTKGATMDHLSSCHCLVTKAAEGMPVKHRARLGVLLVHGRAFIVVPVKHLHLHSVVHYMLQR